MIVATTDQGVLRLSPRGELQRFGAEKMADAGTRVNAVLTDRDGDLWIGTEMVFSDWRTCRSKHADRPRGLRNPTIRTLLSTGWQRAGGRNRWALSNP